MEISLVLKNVVEAVVQTNLIKTPEIIALEEEINKKRERDEKNKEKKQLKKKERIEKEENGSDESSSDDDYDESIKIEEDKEITNSKQSEEIIYVLEDILTAVSNADATIAWKDDYEKEKYSTLSIAHQWKLLKEGAGPFHQDHRNVVRNRLINEEKNTVRKAYENSNVRRRHNQELQSKYGVLGGCDHVAVVVDAIVNAVAWCDLSSVENGLASLDSEKGPFNMNARKIRKKKREDLEKKKIELLNENYLPHYDRSYQNFLETDDNEKIVLKMCYGVNGHMNDLQKLDLNRQEKCKPVVDCIITAVLSWQEVLKGREMEEERLASETPRTVEDRVRRQEKDDKKKLKEIKKANKGISLEEAEDILYQEQNPPQKSEEIELKERYETACEIIFSSSLLKEYENKVKITQEAEEIPTVRMRIDCAKSLKNADIIGLSDPFVIVYDTGNKTSDKINDKKK